MDTNAKVNVGAKMIENIDNNINELKQNVISLENKLDLIINLLDGDVKHNCERMGKHINFIENVYENVKNPLNFLCNKINMISFNKNQTMIDNKMPNNFDGLELGDIENQLL